MVRPGRARRHPVRRRLVRGRGRDTHRGPRPGGHDRHGPVRPGAGAGPHLAGRPRTGRRVRPAPGGPAPPARLHAAALPAELHRLHARRLDRHPRRRPLRDQPHAHRRLRGVRADAHPARLVRVPPPSRIRRGPGPEPAGHRLGGHPRRDHRGVAAHPGPAVVPRHGGNSLPHLGSRLRGHPGDRTGQAVAGQPAPARPRAGPHRRRHGRYAGAAHRRVRVVGGLTARPHGAGGGHRTRGRRRDRRRRDPHRRRQRHPHRTVRRGRRVARRVHPQGRWARRRPGRDRRHV